MTTRRAERTASLPGPIATAWEAVMSPDIAPLIDPAVREWRPDTDPVRVGTRFTIRGRIGFLPIRAESEVVRWEPPRCGVFESRKGSGPLRMTATHRFEPTGEEVRYTWRVDVTGPSPIAAPTAWLFRRAIDRQQRTLAAYLRVR